MKRCSKEVLLRCEIRDTGIGITQEVRERLFQAFVQADGSTMRKFGGTGLGLVICQQLVHAMDGQIGIESTPGAGSTFWFTMRLGKQAGARSELRSDRSEGALRLLVVDDNATSRELLHQQITSFGFRNGCARNGEEALELLNQAALANDAYPLAIIDSQMPGMDGFALATNIKSNPLLQGMRLILLTPFAQTPRLEDLIAGRHFRLPSETGATVEPPRLHHGRARGKKRLAS